MTDINTLIAEMRAGLEGVTPGPWAYVPHFFADGEIRRRSVCYERSKYDWIDLVSDMNSEADSAHIARCHPDNIRALLDEIEYWRKDSAAAWDKCEEHRLEIERLQSKLAVYDATNAAKVEKPR